MQTSNSQDLFIKKYLAALSNGWSLDQFADALELKPSTVQRYCSKIFKDIGLRLEPLPKISKMKSVVPINDIITESINYTPIVRTDTRKRIVITSAQNATPVFKPFLKSIINYCDHNDAQLMVLPYRYKNPTSLWNSNNETDEWWDNSILEYLVKDYVQICNGLRVMGHINIQPTASNPLSGFDTYTGIDSAIFGHPRVQLNVVPTPSKLLPKILTTCGSITKQNYTDSKVGHKSHFHHSFSAVVVEIDTHNDIFHIRHIHSDNDGSFYDLDKLYKGKTITTAAIAGLVTGDSHVEFIDTKVVMATYYNHDSIVNVLKPPVVVFHDVEDFYPRNHHHKNNPFLAAAKHHMGRNDVEYSLQKTANFLDSCVQDNIHRVVVKSNHDEAFDRWLKETDIRHDPANARFFHYMSYQMMKHTVRTDTGFSWPDPFEFWCRNPDGGVGLMTTNITFLSRDESYMIGGIEVGFHGDKGPNGARGSARSFTKIGPKTVIAHSHTPKIDEGVYQVGLSAKMNLEYVSGPSSWLQTHCIIYKNGKRTLINIIDEKWRL